MVTPSSPAICGSSGSHTRRLAALENEASANTAIARVGVASAPVDVVELTSKPQNGVGKRGRSSCYAAARQLSSAGDLLLADPSLSVAAMAGEVEMEVVAVIGVVARAQHR